MTSRRKYKKSCSTKNNKKPTKMPKDRENMSKIPCLMCTFPTELILNIFMYLPVKELIKCRQVCRRWMSIIDSLAGSDVFWRRHCTSDFRNIYKVARKKAKPGLLWYDLYRSLSLWPRLANSREVTDEFASASTGNEEIKSFKILDNGILGVHKKGAIIYYDTVTTKNAKRSSITGEYSKYCENDDVIIILGNQLHLFVIRKVVYDSLIQSHTVFIHVKLFLLTDKEVYFVTLEDEIFVCKYLDTLQATSITQSEDCIMTLGYSDGCLNLLTFQREIYRLVEDELSLIWSLEPQTNVLHALNRYNFLEQLDWRIYFQWIYVLNHSVPEGPLRDIIIIKPYGDVFFVGSNWGVLRIYYAPYSDGELDIFNNQPLKQYNFMERLDCPVLSVCPILQIDAMEVEDGHKVFVGMPKKIAVLNFTHNFKRTASLVMLPQGQSSISS